MEFGFQQWFEKIFEKKKELKGETKVWYQRRVDQHFAKITRQWSSIIVHKALNKDPGVIVIEPVVAVPACVFACLLVCETSTGSQQMSLVLTRFLPCWSCLEEEMNLTGATRRATESGSDCRSLSNN